MSEPVMSSVAVTTQHPGDYFEQIPLWNAEEGKKSGKCFEVMRDERIPVTRLHSWRDFTNLLETDFFDRQGLAFRGHRRSDWGLTPGSRHSDSIVFFVIHGKWKIVNIHRLMTGACKPLWNQVYSRLLGDRNECDERSQPDVLLEGSRRPAQTQQWDAA